MDCLQSDVTITAVAETHKQKFGVLVVEFQPDASLIHKDHLVCTVEAVVELRKMIPLLPTENIEDFVIYFALADCKKITIHQMRAVDRLGGLCFGVDRHGPSFRLLDGDTEDKISEALRLACYIKSTIIPDAQKIQNALKVGTVSWKTDQRILCLPRQAPTPRISKAEFTPVKKRIKCAI
ncbi:hypothetical protein DFJ77DRAFT_153763 [Powellomyces hirtus]|nr:hypothetical protein DFJ77DRAFT_153763 [Powellomyces hirtus]